MEDMARLAMIFSALWLAFSASAAADTYRPTRFDDPAAARCKPSNCSLRGAVSAANAHRGRDKIVLGTGVYELALAETPANDNKGGDLDVKGEVRVVGAGPEETTVDANGGSRVFSLSKDAPKTIERMNVTGGSAELGAGILVASSQAEQSPESHALSRLTIQGNIASANGGGIWTGSHPLRIAKTTIAANNAASGGGGVYMGATPTVGSFSAPLVVASSTINGNVAGLGAGLYLDGFEPDPALNDPRAQILNSTFAFNVATVSGGGLASILGADLDANHTTVAYNSADSDSSGGGAGGGIYQSSDASFAIENSLVKENAVGSSGDGPQCAGDFRFDGVITPQGTPGLCNFLGGSVIQPELPPRIGTLADNGGPTKTIEIHADSLANGWNESFCPAKDQRGVARLLTDCDAGAYERP